jgi:hypothetical protein
MSLWAHGELAEARERAKSIVLKLSVQFQGSDEWEAAVRGSDSVLLGMWSRGLDPTPEELRQMEAENAARCRRDEMHGRVEELAGAIDADKAGLAERGWIVPAGARARRCHDDACMYPQVFAVLGFRGPGGPAVGLFPASEFDAQGSFRRRETVTEVRKVELAKVLVNGQVELWEESEEVVRTTTHLESRQGNYCRRETVRQKKLEAFAGKQINKAKDKQDLVQIRNERGEVSVYLDPKSPLSPLVGHDDAATVPADHATRLSVEEILQGVALRGSASDSSTRSSSSSSSSSSSEFKAGTDTFEVHVEEPEEY